MIEQETNAGKLTASQKHFIVEMQLLCESKTPLGVPVEPDVYIMIAVSSLDGETWSAKIVFSKFATKNCSLNLTNFTGGSLLANLGERYDANASES